MDAVEDAALLGLKAPYKLEVTVHLGENWISILDTGIGMTPEQVCDAFVPHVTFKNQQTRNKGIPYRGYKGVGLTFLAYGTDDIALHSKHDGILTRARMKYGRAWAEVRRTDAAMLAEDDVPSPLEGLERGTFVRLQFSEHTRPRQLFRIGGTLKVWQTVLLTRTAAGQILLGAQQAADIKLKLRVIKADGTSEEANLAPNFLFPHTIERTPPFRFLDLVDYYKSHSEHTKPPSEKIRQRQGSI